MTMDRKKELLKLTGDDAALMELVSKMLFLEKRLEELEKLPFIKVNPSNPAQQKATPAAKKGMYGNMFVLNAGIHILSHTTDRTTL